MDRLKQIFQTDSPVVLVTGSGAKRVGRVIIAAFAERGYCCAIHGNRSFPEAQQLASQLQDAGGVAKAFQADLTNTPALHQLIDEVWSHFGRIDVLVNAAAIWEPKRLEEVSIDDVRRHFDINALATFEASRYAGLKMIAQPSGGVIINIGDWATARPYLNYAAYFPSKGAIPALTRSLAVELAARNPRMRVNAVLPGPVMLPSDLSQEQREEAIAATLVKREGTPQHVADAVVLLAENDFITGVCLPVDGGRTICP